MQVHVFRAKGDNYGFTEDQTGSNLPNVSGPWTFVKTMDLRDDDPPRVALSSQEALEGIRRKGFYTNKVEFKWIEGSQ